MNENMFDQIDFGPLKEYLENEQVTDISYDNKGQIHLKTLDKGIYRVEKPEINDAFMEKLAFQCSNVMGKTFNMAHPFLDAESAELLMVLLALFVRHQPKSDCKKKKSLLKNILNQIFMSF